MSTSIEIILKLSYMIIVLVIAVSTVLLAISLWMLFALMSDIAPWYLYALAIAIVVTCDAVAAYLVWLVFKTARSVATKE